jgi:hypothetical protein
VKNLGLEEVEEPSRLFKKLATREKDRANLTSGRVRSKTRYYVVLLVLSTKRDTSILLKEIKPGHLIVLEKNQ